MEAVLLYCIRGGQVSSFAPPSIHSGCKNLSRWGSQVSQFFETGLSCPCEFAHCRWYEGRPQACTRQKPRTAGALTALGGVCDTSGISVGLSSQGVYMYPSAEWSRTKSQNHWTQCHYEHWVPMMVRAVGAIILLVLHPVVVLSTLLET